LLPLAFKGGVGKTTITWALANVVAQEPSKTSLMFDLDAQMSLTQAIALNEDGNPFKDFSTWYDKAQKKKKTIFYALDEFSQNVPFNFGINYDFVYQITPKHHFSILSCCDLVLIPINPDFFAAKGLNLLLNSLKLRIEPFPIPKIGVFMNRAKRPGGSSVKKYSNETQRYLDDVQDVVGDAVKVHNLQARLFNTAIFDRAGFCSA
jgi:cellulose biosynthesis protein BcsQ